jgi:hypothetical protein
MYQIADKCLYTLLPDSARYVKWVPETFGGEGGMGSAFPVDNKGRGFYEHLCRHADMTEYDCAVPYPEVP